MSDTLESRARLRRPERWHLRNVDHAGWFTTGVTWDLPDGMSARWASRMARRRGRVELHDASGAETGVSRAEPVTARRLGRNVELHHARPDLLELLVLAGLDELAVEVWRQAEEREEAGGVEEEDDAADSIA